MRHSVTCWKAVVFGVLIAPASLRAQNAPDASPAGMSTSAADPSPTGEKPKDPLVTDTTETSSEQPEAYAAALDGSGLISLEDGSPEHLLLGTTLAGGWDSNPVNQPSGASSALFTVAPFIGLRAATPTVQALAQYQFTSTSFASAYDRQSMHAGSLRLQRNGSDRLSWELSATGRYGQDAVRFVGSPQLVVAGELPATGPNAASYLPNAGTVTYVDGAFSASYLRTQRDTIQVRVGDVFSRYQGYSGSNSIATTNLSLEHAVSPTLGLFAYQQNSVYYGSLSCFSYGGGIGLNWRVRERTSLTLSGGPQLDTASCGSQQGFAYNVSFSSRLTARSQFYLLAARQPTTSYLGPGLWQQSVNGGYQRQIGLRGDASVNLGHVASSTLVRLSSYSGTYVDGVYGHRLGDRLRATLSYRAYFGDTGGVSFQRNVAQMSLSWTAGVRRMAQ